MGQIVYSIITTIKNTDKSQIYLAVMEGQEGPVIIKRMKTANPEVYKVLAGIQSVYIPQIYAWEEQEDELIVAEEYIGGETLEYYFTQGLLSEEQKLDVALQLCEAVQVLHNCTPQIIHRDIKPSNALMTDSGVIKLIDFDASRQYKKLSEDNDTRILGTADYAAPEQFGYKQTDVRSDIYSMGIVFDMLNFHGEGPAMLVWKRLLDVCTNFDPKKRYKSVNTLEKAIRRTMRLQKYQWYGVAGIFCVTLLLYISLWWFDKPVEEGGEQPAVQAQPVTQEVQVTDTESAGSTVADAEMEEVLIADVILQETALTTDASKTQMLEEKRIAVNEYFLGEMNVDYLFYSSYSEGKSQVDAAFLTDLVTNEKINLENHFRFEESIFIIDNDFMQTLKPSYYSLRVKLSGGSPELGNVFGTYIRIYSEEEPFRESRYGLAGNRLDYYYELHDTLHLILRPSSKARITGLYLINYGAVEPDQYRILYDGRAAELSATLLEQCKNQKVTLFEVEFDNGERETLTVVNPYLQ